MDINFEELLGNIPPITLFTSIISIVLGALASYKTEWSQLFFFSKRLCFDKGEWWRLFTSFFYIGPLSYNFAISLYMNGIYSARLESTCFYKKSADYVFMILFGIAIITFISCLYPSTGFLGMALHSMNIYVWCRKNPHINIQFLFLPMKAPWFPVVLLVFHYISYGRILDSDIAGMLAGHIYYYLTDVLPKLAKARKWKRTEFLTTPRFLSWILRDVGTNFNIYDDEPIPENLEAAPTELEEASILPYDEDEDEEDKEKEDEVEERDKQHEDSFRPHVVSPREEVMEDNLEEMDGLRRRHVPEEIQ